LSCSSWHTLIKTVQGLRQRRALDATAARLPHPVPNPERAGAGSRALLGCRPGRGVRSKAELARLEAVKGTLVLEHKQLTEGLSSGLQAPRSLRQVAVANAPPLLVPYPPAVGATYDETPLPHHGEQGVAVASFDQLSHRGILRSHLLHPRRCLRD